jgi:hypothetical protein
VNLIRSAQSRRFPDRSPVLVRSPGRTVGTKHRIVLFATVALCAATALSAVASPASAAPIHRQPVAGTGSAVASRTVSVANLPAASTQATPDATTVAPQRRGVRALPSRPSTGSKLVTSAASAASGPNAATAGGAVRPLVAPAVVANFAGTNQASGCGGCQPPDPNVAVGATQIVENVNVRMQVFNKTGGSLCSFALSSFLGTADSLSDPRVLYDNLNARWLFTITVVPASGTATPAIWIAASSSSNACGSWFIYRPTFSGGSFPAGTLLDYPISGQDRNALFVSTDNFTPASGENFTVFGVAKSALYAGAGFSFSAFNTASFTAPVSNAGIPMISTTFNYFLGAVPGTGYRLYRMTNSGGAGATLTLQATISSTFSAPSRRVNQPGTTVTLDPLDGRIAWTPFTDNSFIWFAHGIDLSGFPAVRYGAINIGANSATVALAYRSGSSDDFNPSVGLGLKPGGGGYIFVNWAYTDTANNLATSDTVDLVLPGTGVPNLIGTGAVLVNGAVTGQTRFGDYSAVGIDPTNANGSCAVTVQQYYAAGGSWATRIARLGTC